MKRLSHDAYERAVKYLKSEGRPLERARYALLFEGGDRAAVLTALESYQNPDGGFGCGLEPDLRLAESSVIATTIAFQTLRECAAPAAHPIVTRACVYLMATFDSNHLNWPIIPPNVDDAPHAPWWTYEDTIATRLSNPRAEIAVYLYDYAERFPASLPDRIGAAVVDHLLAGPDTLEMHDLLCYLRFYESPKLPTTIKAQLTPKLTRILNTIVTRDPDAWKAYGLPPLSVIATPESPFATLFTSELAVNLDFVMDQQSQVGYWTPNWSWEPLTAWSQAERDWRSVITLNTLLQLRAFDRLG
jgi:hypothetical protein